MKIDLTLEHLQAQIKATRAQLAALEKQEAEYLASSTPPNHMIGKYIKGANNNCTSYFHVLAIEPNHIGKGYFGVGPCVCHFSYTDSEVYVLRSKDYCPLSDIDAIQEITKEEYEQQVQEVLKRSKD